MNMLWELPILNNPIKKCFSSKNINWDSDREFYLPNGHYFTQKERMIILEILEEIPDRLGKFAMDFNDKCSLETALNHVIDSANGN